MLDYILALELILSWNERNFGTQNGGRVQPTHVETQEGSNQTSKLLLYLYWKGKGILLAMARNTSERGWHLRWRQDSSFAGEKDGLSSRNSFTAL